MRIPWKVLSITLAAMLIAGSVAAQETSTPEPLTPFQRRAVRAFAADGIFEGTSCSIEDCSGTVQRWEVAMWIIRLFNYQPTPHETFTDVDSEQPYADFVETLYDEGITVGCRFDPLRYCPESSTGRGQMAAFVTRAFDLNETDPRHGFLDVSPTHVFRDNISALQNAGILSADCYEGERLFCPWQPIAAAEAVEWLYRASLLAPTADRDNGGGNTGGGNTGGGNTGGGNTGGGNTGGGNTPNTNPTSTNPTSTNPTSTNPTSTLPTTTTLPPFIPTLVGNDDIDLVNRECTHLDPHNQGDDKKSYMILDGTYPVSLVFDDNGPYADRPEHSEFFRYDDLTSMQQMNVVNRYRVERNTLRDVYFSHWHVGETIVWKYWIPETVLERVADSIAPSPIEDELLFEDARGNKYRRLRNEGGGLAYGPFDVAPACNAHSHPPPTGNHPPS